MDLHLITTLLSEYGIALAAMLLTLVWLYLEYKASMWLWPVGVLLPIFWIIISIEGRVYGNVVINAYYLVTSIYGWVLWLRKKEQEEHEGGIRDIPWRALLYSLLAIALLYYPAVWLLRWAGDSYPLADALATALSFVGMIWLSNKWRQHWLLWFLANSIYSATFFLLKDYISTFTFVISVFASVLGYLKWTKMQQEQKKKQMIDKLYRLPSVETLPRTLVLANGAFPEHPLPLSLIDRWISGEGLLIACDGAFHSLQGYTDKLPDVEIGDFDSLSEEQRERLKGRLVHIPDQNSNDLTKAMRYLYEQYGAQRVTLLGASGKREDHLLANILLLYSYAPIVEELVMLTDRGYFRLIDGAVAVETFPGQQVSLFAMSGQRISTEGLKWELEDSQLEHLSQGALNEALGTHLILSVSEPIIAFFTYRGKEADLY